MSFFMIPVLAGGSVRHGQHIVARRSSLELEWPMLFWTDEGAD
jgi:hypothetical protein